MFAEKTVLKKAYPFKQKYDLFSRSFSLFNDPRHTCFSPQFFGTVKDQDEVFGAVVGHELVSNGLRLRKKNLPLHSLRRINPFDV